MSRIVFAVVGCLVACGAPEPGDGPPVPDAGPSSTGLASTITRHDITWTLDREYPVGQYVNGDYFVVAPPEGVVVMSVSPAPIDGHHGSGVNVEPQTQPADAGASLYSGTVTFPLTLVADDALISFKSHLGETNDCAANQYRNQGDYCEGFNQMRVLGASVLTAVSAVPLEHSFRPSPLGGREYRTTYTLAALDAVVAGLPALAVDEKPDIEVLIRSRERFQFEAVTNWQRRASAPADNQATYAAYSRNPEVLLALAADYPAEAKKRLLVAVIQHGIDIAGRGQVAYLGLGEGGHNTHLNSVVAVASQLLGNPSFTEIVKALPDSTGEKGQTYLGVNEALWGQACSDPLQFARICDDTYVSGAKDCRDPAGLDDDLSRPGCVEYQSLNGPYYAGQALAMGLLGAVDDFNHLPFFQYTDRWMTLAGATSSTFVDQMWAAHRSSAAW